MKDLSKYGVTIKEVSPGVYHVKGLLIYSIFIYDKNKDCIVSGNGSLADLKQRIEMLYGKTAKRPNPDRYEKFMAVIEYLESVKK